MLNLDTHIVVDLLGGIVTSREQALLKGQAFGISAMVIWEIAKLKQLKRIQIGLDDLRMTKFIDGCVVWPIDVAVALASTQLDFRSDPSDEIIAATSMVHGVPLLTRDAKMRASKMVPLAI